MLTTERQQPGKAELRASMKARRDALNSHDAHAWSATIADLVRASSTFANAGTLCSYMAIGQEVQTMEIIETALAQGKRVVLPRVHSADRRLTLHRVKHLKQLIPGRYGILEPAVGTSRVAPSDVDLFLVPGTVFDTAGNRLGYGAGYYDTLLEKSRGLRVALAYTCQIVPRVPVDAHDIPMDRIVTEAGIIDCHRAGKSADRLRLRNIQCYGHHGVFPEERANGLRLSFDIDLHLDLHMPGLTDHLETTVDYPAIYRLIERIQTGRQFLLLEALVEHIASAILTEFPLVREVTVTARKFNPPVGGPLDAFEVEITRSHPTVLSPALPI